MVGHTCDEQRAVIRDQEDSDAASSIDTTGKVDPQALGWTKRVRIGKQPPDRIPLHASVCTSGKLTATMVINTTDHCAVDCYTLRIHTSIHPAAPISAILFGPDFRIIWTLVPKGMSGTLTPSLYSVAIYRNLEISYDLH